MSSIYNDLLVETRKFAFLPLFTRSFEALGKRFRTLGLGVRGWPNKLESLDYSTHDYKFGYKFATYRQTDLYAAYAYVALYVKVQVSGFI